MFGGFGEARTLNMIVELELARKTARALGYELILGNSGFLRWDD